MGAAIRTEGYATITFEEVEPFKLYECMITFYAVVKYDDAEQWEIEAIHFNAFGGRVPDGTPFYEMCHSYATSDAGYKAIQERIAAEVARDEEARREEIAEAAWYSRGCPQILGGVR